MWIITHNQLRLRTNREHALQKEKLLSHMLSCCSLKCAKATDGWHTKSNMAAYYDSGTLALKTRDPCQWGHGLLICPRRRTFFSLGLSFPFFEVKSRLDETERGLLLQRPLMICQQWHLLKELPQCGQWSQQHADIPLQELLGQPEYAFPATNTLRHLPSKWIQSQLLWDTRDFQVYSTDPKSANQWRAREPLFLQMLESLSQLWSAMVVWK